jgi:hypothetical protein
MSGFEDQRSICVDCEQEFTRTCGEQQFFHEKGFPDLPKRRKECRQSRKAGREQRGKG